MRFIKSIIVFIVALVMLLPSSANAISNRIDLLTFYEHKVLNEANTNSEDWSYLDYIKNSHSSEIILIGDSFVAYYYGFQYTYVHDSLYGSFLIEFNSDEILVNKKILDFVEHEIFLFENQIDDYSSYATQLTWSHFKTTIREYNILGLIPSLVGGIIGGKIGSKVGQLIFGALSGLLVSGFFPEYYICTRSIQEFRIIDIWYEIVEWRSRVSVYHGPKTNRWQNYWFGDIH